MITNKAYPVTFSFWASLPANDTYSVYWWSIDTKSDFRITNKEL